jgi:hypothetical protein
MSDWLGFEPPFRGREEFHNQDPHGDSSQQESENHQIESARETKPMARQAMKP